MEESWNVSFIIGGISGVLGKTSIAPIERVKYIFVVGLEGLGQEVLV